MTKDEFIREYSDKGHRSDLLYESRQTSAFKDIPKWNLRKVRQYFDAVPCDCGAPECQKWKMRALAIEPPEDCSVDPMTMFGPFGPPFTMLDPAEPTITFLSSDDDQGSGQLGEGGEFIPIGGDGPMPNIKIIPNRPDDEPGFGPSGGPSTIPHGKDPLVIFDAPPNSGVASKEPIGLPVAGCPFHWNFILDGKTVGELTFNEETEKLDFSGDAHGSAQILFDLITERFAAWHKEKHGN